MNRRADYSSQKVCLKIVTNEDRSIPETVAADIENGGATPLARRLMELAAIEAYESGSITEYQVMEMLEFESRKELLEFFKRHDVRSKITPAHLEENATANAKEQAGRTWADVMAELDAMPSDDYGPADLSTNKKHLEGYGEWSDGISSEKGGKECAMSGITRDYKTELQWIADHAREYKGQWVALDGDRLIAHGANADEVFDAAEADGADLPLVGFVDDPDKIYAGF